jgi:hypothetical protein
MDGPGRRIARDRWAAAPRPRAESVCPRLLAHDLRLRHPRPCARRKLVDGSSVSCGGWRADQDVRQGARVTMPVRGRMAIARLGGLARRWTAAVRPRAESAHPRGGAPVLSTTACRRQKTSGCAVIQELYVF